MNSLSAGASSLLLKYYFGPNHPCKIRIFDTFHRMLGRPLFTVKYGDSSRLCLNINEFIQFEIIKNGVADPEVWAALEPLVSKKSVVWDIGAHVGSFGIKAAEHPFVQSVYLFEPFPPMYHQLLLNCDVNPELPLTPMNVAVSNVDGEQDLYYTPSSNHGTASLVTKEGTKTRVKTATVDFLISKKGIPAPHILKIDAEEAELLILQGMEKTLSTCPPKAIAFEGYQDWKNSSGTTDVIRFLEARGYTVNLIPFIEDRKIGNFLAVRK